MLSGGGHFGIFGGRYVAETLMPLILDLEEHYKAAKNDPDFWPKSKTSTPITPAAFASVFCRAADRGTGRREDLFQAG
jgi:tryptophan synthase beta subunit